MGDLSISDLLAQLDQQRRERTEAMGEAVDPFLDDEVVEATCDTETPDDCEACT